MSVLSSRVSAVVLAVIVVAGSTLLNTSVKLGNQVEDVEGQFYTDVSGERSIYSRLQEKLSAANGYASVVAEYDQTAADELYEYREELLEACEDEDISDMAKCNAELNAVFSSAENTLAGYTLDADDLEDAEYYAEIFNGAQKMIEENSYNSDVTEFRRSNMSGFPTELLVTLTGVEAPERFE